jgi:hypothetical protein
MGKAKRMLHPYFKDPIRPLTKWGYGKRKRSRHEP